MADDDFQSMLSADGEDVKPLKLDKRQHLDKSKQEKDASVATRKAKALAFDEVEEDPLHTADMTMVEPLDLLEFKRPGVQNGVYRNLRLGKYPIEATLDLHRMTVERARNALYRFAQDCVDNDVRTALITHGKSEGRQTPALLKSCVAHWLPQISTVLAFHTAQKQHGSYGASYVLFKKTEAKKQQTRERFR